MGLAPSLVINLPGFPFENFPSVGTVDLLRAVSSAGLEIGDNYVVDGSSAAGDGGGGVYAWSPFSTKADDGSSTVRPSDRSPGQAGRWVQAGGSAKLLTDSLSSEDAGKGAALVGYASGAGDNVAERLNHMRLNAPGNGGYGYDFRLMETVESIDGTTDGVGKVDAVRVAHTFGGSSVKGGRHAIETFCVMIAPTAADNPDRNYVGGAFTGYATASDNGVLGAELGGMFGLNAVGRLGPAVQHWLNVTGAEINTDVAAGATVSYKSGIQICGFVTDKVQGTDYDAMISLSRQVGGTIWRDGILFSPANGAAPVGAGSTLLRTQGMATCDSGIDIGSYLFTKQAIRVGNTSPSQQAGIGIRQQGNGAVGLHLQRNTDTAPVGNVFQLSNADNTQVIASIDALGNIKGTNFSAALISNGSDILAIGSAAGEIQINKPLVSQGSTNAVVGKVGGSGPATAAQNSWMRLLDQSGAPCWVPVWK